MVPAQTRIGALRPHSGAGHRLTLAICAEKSACSPAVGVTDCVSQSEPPPRSSQSPTKRQRSSRLPTGAIAGSSPSAAPADPNRASRGSSRVRCGAAGGGVSSCWLRCGFGLLRRLRAVDVRSRSGQRQRRHAGLVAEQIREQRARGVAQTCWHAWRQQRRVGIEHRGQHEHEQRVELATWHGWQGEHARGAHCIAVFDQAETHDEACGIVRAVDRPFDRDAGLYGCHENGAPERSFDLFGQLPRRRALGCGWSAHPVERSGLGVVGTRARVTRDAGERDEPSDGSQLRCARQRHGDKPKLPSGFGVWS